VSKTINPYKFWLSNLKFFIINYNLVST
jgi:hypothetical protein